MGMWGQLCRKQKGGVKVLGAWGQILLNDVRGVMAQRNQSTLV